MKKWNYGNILMINYYILCEWVKEYNHSITTIMCQELVKELWLDSIRILG